MRVSETNLHRVVDVISALPQEKVEDMRRQVHFLFDSYFRSMATITMTTLQVRQAASISILLKFFTNP